MTSTPRFHLTMPKPRLGSSGTASGSTASSTLTTGPGGQTRDDGRKANYTSDGDYSIFNSDTAESYMLKNHTVTDTNHRIKETNLLLRINRRTGYHDNFHIPKLLCGTFLHEEIFKSVSKKDRVGHYKISITSKEKKELEVRRKEGETTRAPGVRLDDSSKPSVTLSLWRLRR